MSKALTRLPDSRLEPLRTAYREAGASRRHAHIRFGTVLVALIVVSAWVTEVDVPTLVKNAWRFPAYVANTIPKLDPATLTADMSEWYWGIWRWLRLLSETVLIAYVGTVLGALGAFGACFVASANLVRSRAVVFMMRRSLEFCRTVPDIVFALIFVIAFGLGALPGVLAITIHTLGALGKLFAEVVENIDMKPVEGVISTGARWIETVRFAALPQVLSNFASYTLMRFEINVRSAAIMGFVGAGGIGMDLIEAIRKFYYTDVSAIVLLIVATVMAIDFLTERLRHSLADVKAVR